jgi:hypothetical protein
MYKNNPVLPSEGKINPILRFLRIHRNKGWDYLILGIAGLLILSFLIYGALMWGSVNTMIFYKPEDVVYGKKFRAVHSMNFDPSSRQDTIFQVGSTKKPEIKLSEQYYDFGEVDANQVLTRTFVIANLGQVPLKIIRAYTTCGCTMADFTAAEIPPGKVVLMTLQFDPSFHDMQGTTVRRGVMIETNDPDNPLQEIWIQASIK